MGNQFQKRFLWINIVIMAMILACLNIRQAAAFPSDDFNPTTTEANPAWRFYDPYNTTADKDPGESELTFNGSNALISIPSGQKHDLWTSNNTAPRLLQPISNTDFGIGAKFETAPSVKSQLQGIIVQQADNIFLRFDIYYASTSPRLFIAYINGGTSIIYKSVDIQSFPLYHQVIRSGNQWTFRYSSDGGNWTDAATFTQDMNVTEIGFFAGTAGSNPEFLSSVDYFTDLSDPIADNDAWSVPAPAINVWYDYTQPLSQLGQPGISQQWANILGNVSTLVGLSSLTYSLNGGPEQALPFQPIRRLVKEGDFNIELDHSSLNIGSNVVEITATDSNGLVTKETVTVDYAPDTIWPIPYTATWAALSDIRSVESIAHIVDGLWNLTPEGIRSQVGYDRAIAIGDMDWSSDYEVTVPLTIHSEYRGIGFAVGWQGHAGVENPRIEWPLQALAWIRGPLSNPSLDIITYGGLTGWEIVEAQQPISISKDVTYMLKTYSEPLTSETSRFYVKLWPQSESEPASWNMSADVPTRPGSVLLVAHTVDATFGNVAIKSISDTSDTTAPVISNIEVSTTDTGATITWTTDEPSTSTVNYGPDSNYGATANDATLVTSHSVALTGLNPATTYQYEIVSNDAGNNATGSPGHQFLTASSDPSANNTPSGMVSDAFDGPLDTNVWSFHDPVGDSSVSTTGTQALISVPAGTNHDLWINGLFAPRIRQAANNTDFNVEVKFDSTLSARYQLQGITVEQDDANLLRFDFYTNGSSTRVFSASFANGVPTTRFSTVVTNAAPLYLRVSRTGDQWTAFYSHDGISWTVAGTYTYGLTVTSVGIFGGNAGTTPPAYSVLADYFIVDGLSPDAETVTDTTTPEQHPMQGPVNWTRLSSNTGELLEPIANNGESGMKVVDLDKNGQTDYIISLWQASESLVWYRHVGDTFEKYVIDTQQTELSHSEGFKDIDGDGDIDLIIGDASHGNVLSWWENPYPNYDPNTPWVRREVRNTGKDFYHDSIWGDFDGDGADEYMAWNQKGFQLLLFEVPADPKTSGPWPVSTIFEWSAASGTPSEKTHLYRGTDVADINLDGKDDFVGGCGWFEHTGGTSFVRHPIDDAQAYSQVKAGQLVEGGNPEIVCLKELEAGPLNMYKWDGSMWQVKTLVPRVERSHTLQLGDINGDGHLDIMFAEMGNWGPITNAPTNPNAGLYVLYGDGTGNFTQQTLFTGQGHLEGQLGDIDNDGDLDIVTKPFRHNAPQVDIWINQGI